MHVLHLGAYQYTFGSILMYLTHHVMPENPEANLAKVWAVLKRSYSEHRTSSRFGDLRISMYAGQRAHFPCLKGKAAEVRHLAKPLLAACQAFLPNIPAVNSQIKLLLEMAVTMEGILDEHSGDYSLGSEDARRFREAADTFAQLSTAVSHHFHAQQIVLFNYTIKWHYLLHLGERAAWMNPRLAWNYAGEDFMRVVKRLVQSSHRGTSPYKVVTKVMRKYAQGLGMGFHSDPWQP